MSVTSPSTAVGNGPGGSASFTHEGFTYQVYALTDVMRASLTRWVKKQAIEELRKLRPLLTPNEYEDSRTSLFRDFATGQYEFGTKTYGRFMDTQAGTLALYAVILQREDMTDEQLIPLINERGNDILDLFYSLQGIDPSKLKDRPPVDDEDPNG